MNIATEIRHRANTMFAELKGLRLYDGHKGHISSLQQKDMSDGMEEKVRRVRTPAGVRRFGLPIGSIIGSRGKRLKNLTILDPIYDDWDLVQDTKGKKYDIGKDDDGKWRAFGHNDWDDMVVESDSEDGVYEALNDKLGGNKPEPKPKTTKKPKAVPAKPADTEPKDPSYRRGADRLRRAGINDFRPNQARQVDEMTRDQWEEAQLEVDAGASISEVLAKRAVAQREAQEERQRAYNGGEEIPTDKEVEEWEHERRGHELVSQLGPKQKREYDALKPRYQEMYRSNRAGGDSHKQAMDKNPANARRVPSPNTPGKQVAERDDREWEDIGRGERMRRGMRRRGDGGSTPSEEEMQEDHAARRSNRSSSRRIAVSTQGANKPKAERTDAEIEAGLNNAFKKQFDTLSGSQKRKYFAAFRQGKTHSEAMAAARGGSGKAQGTLF